MVLGLTCLHLAVIDYEFRPTPYSCKDLDYFFSQVTQPDDREVIQEKVGMISYAKGSVSRLA